MRKPYSYHTFIYPFVLTKKDDGVVKQGDHKTFVEHLVAEQGGSGEEAVTWVRESDEAANVSCGTERCPRDTRIQWDDWRAEYARKQYFNQSARSLVCSDEESNIKTSTIKKRPFIDGGIESPVERFTEFLVCQKNGQPIRNRGTYRITKKYRPENGSADAGVEEVFTLIINNIKLRIYEEEAVVVIFEMEYYGDKTSNGLPSFKKDDLLDDVNKINEYGRRIRFPYLGTNIVGFPMIMADSIELAIDGVTVAKECFRKTYDSLILDFEKVSPLVRHDYVFEPIWKLLRLEEFLEESQMVFRSLFDDRMFVCSIAADAELIDDISSWHSSTQQYRYLDYYTDAEKGFSSELYKFAFIETSPTCMSRAMRHRLFKNSIYDRWIDYGTIHAVTHHSFVSLMGKNPEEHVIDSFLNLYIELCVISLLQRTTILWLSERAANTARLLSGGSKLANAEQLTTAKKLFADYAQAESKIMLQEVTPQEQGVELYQMLLEQLYIKESHDALDRQMNNLYEYANISYDDLLQKKVDGYAIIAIGLAAIGVAVGVFGINAIPFEGANWCLPTIVAEVCMLFLLGVAWVVHCVSKKWKFPK